MHSNINIHGRNYIYDEENGKFDFSIEETIPNYFTKYYSLTDYNVESIEKNYLYAAHPKELNDPFDCFNYLIDTSKMSDKDIDEIAYRQKKLNIDLNIDEIKKDRSEFSKILNKLFEGCGIISMSDADNENPNLWANYANKHKGFSVTYKKEAFLKESFKGPFRISYYETLPKLEFDRDIIGSLFLYLITVKSIEWSNEKEWRYIGIGKDTMYIPCTHHGEQKTITIQNRKIPLSNDSIFNIKLGFYFFDSTCMKIERNNLFDNYIIDLNKRENKNKECNIEIENKDNECKIDLLKFIKANNIPLFIMVMDRAKLKFKPIQLEGCKFNPDTNIFKYSLPRFL